MNFGVDVQVNWNSGAKKSLLEVGDKITYTVARITLDKTVNYIPFKSGKMRGTSTAGGVRGEGVYGSENNYYIGSFTTYARYVWNMDSGTHWSEPGTFGKWYETIWKQQKNSIMKQAIEENKLS